MIRHDGRRVSGVDTAAGSIEAEYVINCGGMWGRQLAALAGVHVPLQALAHYYVVTEAIPGLARGLPTIKSSDDWMYVKNEGDGLMVGFLRTRQPPVAVVGTSPTSRPSCNFPTTGITSDRSTRSP